MTWSLAENQGAVEIFLSQKEEKSKQIIFNHTDLFTVDTEASEDEVVKP